MPFLHPYRINPDTGEYDFSNKEDGTENRFDIYYFLLPYERTQINKRRSELRDEIGKEKEKLHFDIWEDIQLRTRPKWLIDRMNSEVLEWE